MFFNGCLVVSRKISYHTENKKSERRRPIFLFYQQLWNCLRTGHAHLMQIWNVGATCFKWFQYILYWVLVKPGREKTTNIPTMSFDILSPVELEIDYHGWRNKPTKKQQKKIVCRSSVTNGCHLKHLSRKIMLDIPSVGNFPANESRFASPPVKWMILYFLHRLMN